MQNSIVDQSTSRLVGFALSIHDFSDNDVVRFRLMRDESRGATEINFNAKGIGSNDFSDVPTVFRSRHEFGDVVRELLQGGEGQDAGVEYTNTRSMVNYGKATSGERTAYFALLTYVSEGKVCAEVAISKSYEPAIAVYENFKDAIVLEQFDIHDEIRDLNLISKIASAIRQARFESFGMLSEMDTLVNEVDSKQLPDLKVIGIRFREGPDQPWQAALSEDPNNIDRMRILLGANGESELIYAEEKG